MSHVLLDISLGLLLTHVHLLLGDPWTALHVSGKDVRNISINKPGEVTVPVKCPQTEEVEWKSKSMTCAQYLAPYHPYPLDESQKYTLNPFRVSDKDVIDAFFSERQYEIFLPEDERDDTNVGELAKGLHITPKKWHTAMLHASLGNMLRLLNKNVSTDGSVGYLSGEAYNLLCSGT